jgi:hypothetical protein
MKGDLDRKNVSLSLVTYERLASYGRLGESFSMALDRILDFAESKGLTRDALYKPPKERNV